MTEPNVDLSNIDAEALAQAKALAEGMDPSALADLIGSEDVQALLPDDVKSSLEDASPEGLQATIEKMSDE